MHRVSRFFSWLFCAKAAGGVDDSGLDGLEADGEEGDRQRAEAGEDEDPRQLFAVWLIFRLFDFVTMSVRCGQRDRTSAGRRLFELSDAAVVRIGDKMFVYRQRSDFVAKPDIAGSQQSFIMLKNKGLFFRFDVWEK